MLEYFIQYMESVNALHLVQFWLTVESFKLSAQTPKTPTLVERSPKWSPSSANADRSLVCEGTSCSIRRHDVAGSPMNSRAAIELSENAGDNNGSRTGGSKQKVLQRRDTENHKYCNCKLGMHHQATPPPSLRQQGSQMDLTDDHPDVASGDCKYGPVEVVDHSPTSKHLNHIKTGYHSTNLS